jgi:hypothetical protein
MKILCSICHIKFLKERDFKLHNHYVHETNKTKSDLVVPLKSRYSPKDGTIIGYRYYYNKVQNIDVLFCKSHNAILNKIFKYFQTVQTLIFYLDVCILLRTVEKFTGNIIEERYKFCSRPTQTIFCLQCINFHLFSAKIELRNKLYKILQNKPNYYIISCFYIDLHRWSADK